MLWEKGANETSATETTSANVTSETPQQGGEPNSSASYQSNGLSVDKGSKVSGIIKESGEEVAEMEQNSAASRLATSAVMEALQGSGIEVVEATDAQVDAVLGAVDVNAELMAKKKRALETASVSQEEHQPTVVSSADGAKVLNNLEKAANFIKNSLEKGKRGVVFNLQLPKSLQNMIKKAMG